MILKSLFLQGKTRCFFDAEFCSAHFAFFQDGSSAACRCLIEENQAASTCCFNAESHKKTLAQIAKALSMTRNLRELLQTLRFGFLFGEFGSGNQARGNVKMDWLAGSPSSRIISPADPTRNGNLKRERIEFQRQLAKEWS